MTRIRREDSVHADRGQGHPSVRTPVAGRGDEPGTSLSPGASATGFARCTADGRRLTDQIAGAAGGDGAEIVWVLQGPDPITPDRVRRVNAVYERQSDASGGLLADAGKAVSPASARYTWTQYLPCTAYEREHTAYCTQPGSGRTALHRDDDYLHFCLDPTTSTPKPRPVRSRGILRITQAITRAVASALNRPPATWPETARRRVPGVAGGRAT